MKKLSLSSPIHPMSLSLKKRQELTDRLYKIHSQIFDGVDKEQFRRYVIEPKSDLTRIRLIQSESGQDIGYITFQRFVVKSGRRNCRVYRTEVGLLPQYRGNNATFGQLFGECAWDYIKNGFRRSMFVATPVHPAPYMVANRSLLTMYPRPGQRIPQRVFGIMDQLSDNLGLESGSGETPFVKKVGWIVRNTPTQKERIDNSQEPGIRFYCEQNPMYSHGNGLMILIPFSIANGAFGLGVNLLRRARKIFKAMPPALVGAKSPWAKRLA